MTTEVVPPEPRLTAKGRSTRNRIVVAAADLMFANGVAGTSTDDVLRLAGGLSPSQLYHYFSDKNALVRAVVEHQTAVVLATHVPVLSRLDSFDALVAWRDMVVDLQQRGGCMGGCPVGSLASELADHDATARGSLAQAFGQWQAAIRDGLAAMQQRGELNSDADPEYLSLALLTALQGGLLMTQTRRDTYGLEVVLDAMLERIRYHAATSR